MNWTDWKPLNLTSGFDRVSLAETLDGGQSFRWIQEPTNSWIGQWSDIVVRIRFSDKDCLEWSTPTGLMTPDTEQHLLTYLGADTKWNSLQDQLPWRSDPHLKVAIEAFPGLRILRQPMQEALLGFLCSATKRIVQIKQMCNLLARNIGREITPGFWRLPTFAEIADSDPTAIDRCLLGFRAKYILGTARFLAERPGWLTQTEALPYPEAKEQLIQLPGVGEKVADCVLLFGAGKLEAFPVDTWIVQTLKKRYALDGWTHRHLTQFGRTHFGPAAGLAQQFLFSWERRFGQSGV